MSTHGYGVVVEGITAIRQRMDLAIRTTKGSDPLRPEFGSNVYKYVDAPHNVAIPNITRELLDCLDIWVKDIQVVGIRGFLKELGNPAFEITFRLIDDSITQAVVYDAKAGIVSSNSLSEIIVQAFIPDNPTVLRYNFQFFKNNLAVMPYQPVIGFESIAEMFAWMQTNYAYLGRWYLLADRIVCYMKSDGVVSASLSIALIPNLTMFEAAFPELSAGEHYKILFTINGVLKESPDTFLTPGAALSWVIVNWSVYATWSVQYFLGGVLVGEFSSEFSSDFFVDEDINAYKLIGYSVLPGVTASLEIVKV